MTEPIPPLRKDLEFFPIQQGSQNYVLIRDHLGLVSQGKAISLPLFQLMIMFDGKRDIRDIQMHMMRQRGGVLVDGDEIKKIVRELDQSYLLESERFFQAKERIVQEFVSRTIRAPSHSGTAYPSDGDALRKRIDEILSLKPAVDVPEGDVLALVCPHIDLNVGQKVYASAYNSIKGLNPSRVIIIGVGHNLVQNMFSISSKDFETPLGIAQNDTEATELLKGKGEGIISGDDFAHRSEHSIEFQLIFLQHILPADSFRIVPILCGSLQMHLPQYKRSAYLERAGSFLETLRDIAWQRDHKTLIVAGIDLSHTGPKFGHQLPATHMESQSTAHDRRLLDCLSRLDADGFWEESERVNDKFNVCGFSAIACLLELLPPCRGELLDYEIWHEAPTRSAVSFASLLFLSL